MREDRQQRPEQRVESEVDQHLHPSETRKHGEVGLLDDAEVEGEHGDEVVESVALVELEERVVLAVSEQDDREQDPEVENKVALERTDVLFGEAIVDEVDEVFESISDSHRPAHKNDETHVAHPVDGLLLSLGHWEEVVFGLDHPICFD